MKQENEENYQFGEKKRDERKNMAQDVYFCFQLCVPLSCQSRDINHEFKWRTIILWLRHYSKAFTIRQIR